MPPVGFEPTIPAGERPQTYALDRADTGTGYQKSNFNYLFAVHDFTSVRHPELSQNSPENKKKNLCHSSYKHDITQISMATTCRLLTGRRG